MKHVAFLFAFLVACGGVDQPKDEDDHGHEHTSPHHGIVAPFEGGHLELKLHDDKGDLELWLATDPNINKDNEDEDGLPNIRDGKTNYFIFPGDTGADASWLQGKDFKATVKVSFDHAGKAHASEEFELVPHTH